MDGWTVVYIPGTGAQAVNTWRQLVPWAEPAVEAEPVYELQRRIRRVRDEGLREKIHFPKA